MKKYLLSFLGLTLIGASIQAQEYTTPNTGENFTLSEIAQLSPTTVTLNNDSIFIHSGILVSPLDTLSFGSGEQIYIDSNKRITIEGTLLSIGTELNPVFITAIDSLLPYDGFRFENDSKGNFDFTSMQFGGGIRVLTPNFSITNSRLYKNVDGVATSGVISLSYGSPLVANNVFLYNETPAVSSPANREVAAQIINNYMEANNQDNENRPQINMGTTGSDTLKIIGNTIFGDTNMIKVGGIAVSNFFGDTYQITAIIADNIIKDNRYGITIAGSNAYVEITDNIIEDNNTQNNPMLGGSGISVNTNAGGQVIIASGNEIRGNLWGITVIDQGSINLGDGAGNPGNNVFSNNGNGGAIYALYNNTGDTIWAKNNCWIEGNDELTLEDATDRKSVV